MKIDKSKWVECEYCNTLTKPNGKYWESGLAICSSKCLEIFIEEN